LKESFAAFFLATGSSAAATGSVSLEGALKEAWPKLMREPGGVADVMLSSETFLMSSSVSVVSAFLI
jgi:hypothetical protein